MIFPFIRASATFWCALLYVAANVDLLTHICLAHSTIHIPRVSFSLIDSNSSSVIVTFSASFGSIHLGLKQVHFGDTVIFLYFFGLHF